MANVAVDDGALVVACAGTGTPVVLLHGWALDSRAWAPQRPLANRFRLIIPDRRGFGRSTAPFDITAETQDLATLHDALGLERTIMVGMSQGGRVALRFALAHPERLAGLVLQGAPLDGFQPEPHGEDIIPLTEYRALVRSNHLEVMKAHWSKHKLMQGIDTDPLLADYDGRDLLAPQPTVNSVTDVLSQITTPTLVVTGETDTPWRQLVGDALAYGIPNARRARLPGGHLCNISHPESYNALIGAFAEDIIQRQ